jgi:hypothetical protein
MLAFLLLLLVLLLLLLLLLLSLLLLLLLLLLLASLIWPAINKSTRGVGMFAVQLQSKALCISATSDRETTPAWAI